MSRSRRAVCIAALAAASSAIGCGDGRVDPRRLVAPGSASATKPLPQGPPARVIEDFLADLPNCDIGHRGLVLDGGTDALAARYGWTGARGVGESDVEHDGSTWVRAGDRRLDLRMLVVDKAPLFVAARGQGRASKAAQVYVDDQPLGTLNFGRDEIKVAQTPATSLAVDPGLHMISLRFSGRAHADEGFADLDWIRVGAPEPRPEDGAPETYGAPTMRDLVLPAAAIGGVPHRAIAMRAPGFVRCPLRLTKRAAIRAFIGLTGEGSGDAEIRVLSDGKPTQVVQTTRVESTAGRWITLDQPLGPWGSGVVEVELTATHATRGSRVLFGDPEVVVAAAPPQPTPQARAAIVVVLDGVDRKELPPWAPSGAPELSTLSELALVSTTFDRHRGPTTLVSGVVASLLTGLSPRAHGLNDLGARLSASITTIASVARDASVRTAMFTGVPMTFRAFGFAEAWERFAEFAPSSDDPATAPIDAAATWVTEVARATNEPRMLAVVHARGAHPPWDVKDISKVPPKDYTGVIDPRRAAQTLAKLRRPKAREVLSDADRTRISALEALALAGQDRALGGLVAALKTANLWDSTLFVVTGDVSSSMADTSLYGDALPLDERLLSLPLYVHFPGGVEGGKRVTEPTDITDVSRTALSALGLAFARPGSGRDLSDTASGSDEGTRGPQIATLGESYSARWDNVVLRGRFPKAPSICDLALDAACAFDRKDLMPIATSAIFTRLALADAAARALGHQREPATLDGDTAAALSVWGAE